MRLLFALPLLLAASACGVQNDPANDQVTLQYNEQRIEETASDIGNSAQDMGAAIANEAEETAAKIDNTDVDVRVNEGGEGAETPPPANNQ